MNFNDLIYQAGLTAQGCGYELDDYTKAAIERFYTLTVKAATQEAHARANQPWARRCGQLVAAEREAIARAADWCWQNAIEQHIPQRIRARHAPGADTLALAREAGFNDPNDRGPLWQARINRLVTLAQIKECEACALECDELAELNRTSPTDSMWQWGECAAALRMRAQRLREVLLADPQTLTGQGDHSCPT